MSQEALAEAINVSPQHIRYIEQGQAAPSFPLMEHVMKVFKVKATDLFDTSYEPPASDKRS